jgi:hypothetical protein
MPIRVIRERCRHMQDEVYASEHTKYLAWFFALEVKESQNGC